MREHVETLGDGKSLALMDIALAVARRQVQLARQRLAADQNRPNSIVCEELGELLITLVPRLLDLGYKGEELLASQEAADILGQLVKARPDFLPGQSGSQPRSLNNLGIAFANLDHREEVLAASQGALGIRRQLAKSQPGALLRELATSLSNTRSFTLKTCSLGGGTRGEPGGCGLAATIGRAAAK